MSPRKKKKKVDSPLVGGDLATTTVVNPHPLAGSAPNSLPCRSAASGWAVARGRKQDRLPTVKLPHIYRSPEARRT